jgi:integrase/recombinase XerD
MKYKRKKDSDFWKLARRYLHDYMPITRNLSDKSVEAYKHSLKVYLQFLETEKELVNDKVDFDVFTRANIKDFISWLKGNECAPKTVNLRLTAIRSFLKYCSEEDFELRGIYTEVCSIKKVKEEKRPIVYLQPNATAAILNAYDTTTAKHRRNRMMLIMLYDTGARVQELADMNISSLHLMERNPFVTLIGKGRKSRNVPLLNKTVLHLNEYLKEFHPEMKEQPLFYSLLDGKPHRLSTDSISLVLKYAADKARESCEEVPNRVHCHMIRKTKAMDLYKNGVPLPFIMQLLGHESMSTTSGFYAFATLEMMSDAMNKAAPSIDKEEKLWKKEDLNKLLYSLD